MTVWLLSSGVFLVGIALTAVFALSLHNLTQTQFGFAVMILALLALFIGFLLMWTLSWLTATPVLMVRVALKRVEDGDLDCNLVVFDGTELGELQRGSTLWSRDCANGNECATCSAGASDARWPPRQSSSPPNSAARNATSR
jgi:hypothetical protein